MAVVGAASAASTLLVPSCLARGSEEKAELSLDPASWRTLKLCREPWSLYAGGGSALEQRRLSVGDEG